MRFGSTYSEVRLRLSRYASVRGTEMVGAFVNVMYHLDRPLDPVQRGSSNKLAFLIFSVKAQLTLYIYYCYCSY